MLLLYPDKLNENAKVKMILDHLNYPYTYNTEIFHTAVFNTSLAPKHEFDFKTDKPVINGRCTNVLKDNVDKIWGQVSGRRLRIDPQNFMGYCIEKPLTQGTNSGSVVQCPMTPKPDKIYLKWVDTRSETLDMWDYRVVIASGEIVYVFRTRKDKLFTHFQEYDRKYPSDVFTTKEHRNLIKFAHIIGLDFGEIDVLRSNFDGNIYITDVNNLSGLGYFRHKSYIMELSAIFKKKFL